MVISVLERRSEIGLRRALGATRRARRGASSSRESLLLALARRRRRASLLGALVTAGYAPSQGLSRSSSR